jgi:DNA-binding CsgD family transcriptional regulator
VCNPGSRIRGWYDLPFVKKGSLVPFGIHDRLGINGLSTDCSGAHMGINLGQERSLTPQERRLYTQIAGHLGSAHRLRKRLRTGEALAEAVVSFGGRVEHAEGAAKGKETLARLSEVARAIDRARTKAGRQAERSLDPWPAMVSTQWTMVETTDPDGRGYLLARQNHPHPTGLGGLTERESQVLSCALLGHHNKLIAYELGVSHSTVRVLLHRAAQKLGVRSRAELVTLGRRMVSELRGGFFMVPRPSREARDR